MGGDLANVVEEGVLGISSSCLRPMGVSVSSKFIGFIVQRCEQDCMDVCR